MQPTVTVLPDRGGMREVRCAGEFDADTQGLLQAACERAASAPDVDRLVLDVREVTFADSSFLNLLLVARQKSNLTLVGPLPAQLARLLQMTGADLLFAIDDGPDRAAG
ncbi:STAS domain-containing protein [Streptomyces goshikiensis]